LELVVMVSPAITTGSSYELAVYSTKSKSLLSTTTFLPQPDGHTPSPPLLRPFFAEILMKLPQS
jgi:hypothetical protein